MYHPNNHRPCVHDVLSVAAIACVHAPALSPSTIFSRFPLRPILDLRACSQAIAAVKCALAKEYRTTFALLKRSRLANLLASRHQNSKIKTGRPTEFLPSFKERLPKNISLPNSLARYRAFI